MHTFILYSLLGLFTLGAFSGCNEKETTVEKKVERAVEYDEDGNKVLYTADGERELINEDCD